MDTSVTEPITTWGGSELDWPHDWLVLQLGVRVTRPSVGTVRLSLCVYVLTQASPLASEGKSTPWKA